MKRVSVIEWMKEGESLGFAPVILEKGKKPVMFTDQGKACAFPTRKQAKEFGMKKKLESNNLIINN